MAFQIQVRTITDYFEPVMYSDQPADGVWRPALYGQLKASTPGRASMSDADASTFSTREIAEVAMIGVLSACAMPSSNQWRVEEIP